MLCVAMQSNYNKVNYRKGTARRCVQGGQKRDHRLIAIILSNLNRFQIFFTGRFLGKFAVKWILKISLHLAYVVTLPCEIFM